VLSCPWRAPHRYEAVDERTEAATLARVVAQLGLEGGHLSRSRGLHREALEGRAATAAPAAPAAAPLTVAPPSAAALPRLAGGGRGRLGRLQHRVKHRKALAPAFLVLILILVEIAAVIGVAANVIGIGATVAAAAAAENPQGR